MKYVGLCVYMLGTASYLSRSVCKLNIITMTVSLAEGENKATALLIFQVMAQDPTYPVDVYKVNQLLTHFYVSGTKLRCLMGCVLPNHLIKK